MVTRIKRKNGKQGAWILLLYDLDHIQLLKYCIWSKLYDDFITYYISSGGLLINKCYHITTYRLSVNCSMKNDWFWFFHDVSNFCINKRAENSESVFCNIFFLRSCDEIVRFRPVNSIDLFWCIISISIKYIIIILAGRLQEFRS